MFSCSFAEYKRHRQITFWGNGKLKQILYSSLKNPNSPKHSETKINQIIELHVLLESIGIIHELISDFNCKLMQQIATNLSIPFFTEFAASTAKILSSETLAKAPNLLSKSRKFYAIKQGINGLLDASRVMYEEAIQDIVNLHESLVKNHGMGIKLNFDSSSGSFYFSLKNDLLWQKPPQDWINIRNTKTTTQFSTVELLKLSDRAQEIMNEIYILSEK